jgi:hypothetical protein
LHHTHSGDIGINEAAFDIRLTFFNSNDKAARPGLKKKKTVLVSLLFALENQLSNLK